uniref:(northern house mosquito) hypothetical protein n=1 Tax=Culex pipiens TaxID=7175 RepID=A0A8D8GGG2_CULPI
MGQTFILAKDKANLYLLINDLVPNKRKLKQYNIGRIDSEICDECGQIDTNSHRLRTCTAGSELREWMIKVLRKRFGIQLGQIDDILFWQIDENSHLQKAAMWLVVHYVAFCVDKFPGLSLFVFQKSIREFRWNSRTFVKRYFDTNLNIC